MLICNGPGRVIGEIVVRPQRKPADLSASQQNASGIGGVANIRHQGQITRIQDRQAQVNDAFLRAKQRQHLGIRVEHDTEAPVIEVCNRLPETGSLCKTGIPMFVWPLDGLNQRVNHGRRGHTIRAADVQANYVVTFGSQRLYTLRNGRKDVGWQIV